MATGVTTQRFRSKNQVYLWDHDPDSASATVVTPDAGTTKRYVALRDAEVFFVAAMSTVCTTGITLLEILAATDATGTNATVVLAGSTVAADAQGDWTSLEVTAAQVREVGAAAGFNFTHVTARITLGNSGDEAAVVYVLGERKFEYLNLTPVSTIS